MDVEAEKSPTQGGLCEMEEWGPQGRDLSLPSVFSLVRSYFFFGDVQGGQEEGLPTLTA